MKVFSTFDIDNGEGFRSYYLISDSGVVNHGKPLFLPEFDDDFRMVPSVVFRVGRLGKCISERFAGRYIDGVSIGLALRACDTLKKLKEEGLPLTPALSFDGSAAVGEFGKPEDMMTESLCSIEFKIDGETVLSIADEVMSRGERLLSFVSRDNKLQTGDLLILPLVSEGIPVKVGMNIEASIHAQAADGRMDSANSAADYEKKFICRIR